MLSMSLSVRDAVKEQWPYKGLAVLLLLVYMLVTHVVSTGAQADALSTSNEPEAVPGHPAHPGQPSHPATTHDSADLAYWEKLWESVLMANMTARPVLVPASSSSSLLQVAFDNLDSISRAIGEVVGPLEPLHLTRSRLSSQGASGAAAASQAAASNYWSKTNTEEPLMVDQKMISTTSSSSTDTGSNGETSSSSTAASDDMGAPSGTGATAAAGAGTATPGLDQLIKGFEGGARAGFLLSTLSSTRLFPEYLGNITPAQELAWLQAAAKASCVDALLALADRYMTGRGVEPNCEHGMFYLKLAAAHVAARVEKEGHYHQPPGTPHLRDIWMNPNTLKDMPVMYDDSSEQIDYEAYSAMAGDASAQRSRGFRRLEGLGMDRDPEAALEDFTAAARAGDAFALFSIGYMYLRGVHVQQDSEVAIHYFHQAAERGLAEGHNALGVMYFNGQGVPQNITLAIRHFTQASDLRNADSMYNMGTIYLEGVGVPKNATNAELWYQSAFRFGHWRAPYSIALIHDAGRDGVAHDCSTAESYLWRFIAERSSWGLGLRRALKLYQGGEYWPALLQYLLLAEQGCEVGAANAGFMLLRGEGAGGEAALRLGARMLFRSALLNSTDSMVALSGLLLEHPWLSELAPGSSAGSDPQAGSTHPEEGSGSGPSSTSSNHSWSRHEELDFAPPYGGPTAYLKGYSFAVRAPKKQHLPVPGEGMVWLASAPFPRDGYGHEPPRRGKAGSTGTSSGSSERAGSAVNSSSSSGGHGGAKWWWRFLAGPNLADYQAAADAAADEGQEEEQQQQQEQQGPQVLQRPPGVSAAILWLQQAADMGDAEAVYNLAWCYEQGSRVARNSSVADRLIWWAMDLEAWRPRDAILLVGHAVLQLQRLLRGLLGAQGVEMLHGGLHQVRDALGWGGPMGGALDQPTAQEELLRALEEARLWAQRSNQLQERAPQQEQQQNAGEEAEAARGRRLSSVGTGSREVRGLSKEQGGWGVLGLGSGAVTALKGYHGWVRQLLNSLGADKVDPDNLALTILLGALAGVLWLRQRQMHELQAQARMSGGAGAQAAAQQQDQQRARASPHQQQEGHADGQGQERDSEEQQQLRRRARQQLGTELHEEEDQQREQPHQGQRGGDG